MLRCMSSGYSAMESKVERGFGPTGPIQSCTLHWGDTLCHLGKLNITSIAEWHSPFNANMECCLSLPLIIV